MMSTTSEEPRHCADCGRLMLPGVAANRCLECMEFGDDDD